MGRRGILCVVLLGGIGARKPASHYPPPRLKVTLDLARKAKSDFPQHTQGDMQDMSWITCSKCTTMIHHLIPVSHSNVHASVFMCIQHTGGLTYCPQAATVTRKTHSADLRTGRHQEKLGPHGIGREPTSEAPSWNPSLGGVTVVVWCVIELIQRTCRFVAMKLTLSSTCF